MTTQFTEEVRYREQILESYRSKDNTTRSICMHLDDIYIWTNYPLNCV